MGSLYAADVIKIARDWIGYEEGSNNWNIFADVLDRCGYFTPQEKQNVPWCAIFCDFCALQAAIPQDRDNDAKKYDAQYFLFQPSKNNYSASVSAMAAYFRNAGAYYEAEDTEPRPGDMIFFGTQHVGIIEEVSESVITTIEGNAGNMVQRKWYDKGDPKITGYGRPRYDGETAPDPSSGDPNETIKEMEQIIKDIKSLLSKLEDLIF